MARTLKQLESDVNYLNEAVDQLKKENERLKGELIASSWMNSFLFDMVGSMLDEDDRKSLIAIIKRAARRTTAVKRSTREGSDSFFKRTLGFIGDFGPNRVPDPK